MWKRPVYSTALRALKIPLYAGAYAWGRTWTETYLNDGQARNWIRNRVNPELWTVWLKEHQPGYIDWMSFEANHRLLPDNIQMRGKMSKGTVRLGKSLLAGLLLCGHCGRRKTGRGHNWNQSRVCSLRNYRGIPALSQRPDEFCNLQEVASQPGISPSSVRKMIRRKLLPGRQVVAMAP